MKDFRSPKTILFCPLHWGLGHIARDLPLIREFHNHGHRVIVAASPAIQKWLAVEMPEIETTLFNGPDIHYSKNDHLLLTLFTQLPSLLSWLRKEQKKIQALVSQYHPHLIISDNRYGARHPKIGSVIITHQLMLKMPKYLKWAEWPFHCLIRHFIGKFNECWVPDFSKPHSLAGDLVHKYPLPANVKLIGPLSRFDNPSQTSKNNARTHRKLILCIISGPEPQRTILEKHLKTLLLPHKDKTTLVTGTPEETKETISLPGHMQIYNHLLSSELLDQINAHKTIVARAGYSTIMDMYFLKKHIYLVPTPGQKEQEYLADYHNMHNHHKINQSNIDQILDYASAQKKPQAIQKGKEHFREILRPFFIHF
jgi:uncharacterized protein (TIGR00661 family)